jgi:phosphate transport system substrate-binding protein
MRLFCPPLLRAVALAMLGVLAGGAGCNDAPSRVDTPTGEASGRPLGGEGFTGTLRLGTTPELAAIVRRQADDFRKLYPQTTITVTELSARAAIVGVLRGELESAIVDRSMNAEETGLAEEYSLAVGQTLIGEGAVVAVVPEASTVRAIPVTALQSLLAGRSVPWAGLSAGTAGEARLVLTDRNAGTVEYVARRLLPAGALPQSAIRGANERDVLARVAERPDAVGLVSALTLRADTTARIRTVALVDSVGRTVQPSPRAVYLDEYPLRQPIVLVTRGARGGIAAGFATFVLGTQGQETVQRAGLVPARPPVREFNLNSGDQTETAPSQP